VGGEIAVTLTTREDPPIGHRSDVERDVVTAIPTGRW
jgi:hypothetical protein